MTTPNPPETQTTVGNEIALVSAALVECQGKLKAANMDATNPFFKSKYATLGAVIEASREALYGAGLALQQNVDLHDGTVSVHTIIRHKSGQMLDGGTLSLPIGENERNSDAQLAGSIMTYLKRYAWASVLGIYADEDRDGNDAPKGSIKRPVAQLATLTHPPANSASQSQPSTPTATPEEPKIGPKYRMQTLNRLQAAPGGHQRALVHQYLTVKGYILPTEEPEDWPLARLPKSAEEFVALGESIKAFEREQLEGRVSA